MIKVGAIKQIWRYPVKGMAGEQVRECSIGPLGIEGDRTWALRDVMRREIQSCKFRPELLTCTASYNDKVGENVLITFADGTSIASNEPEIHQLLSQLVGHESTLEQLKTRSELDFFRRHKRDDHTWLEELKETFTREPGEPYPDFSTLPQQAQDFVTVPGTFFLVTPFHIITTASLNYLKNILPNADWDVRRFRPNIIIETSSADEGLVEQDWIGKQLTIADSYVECTAGAPRCGAVTLKQAGLSVDPAMLRTIIKDADQNLGIYGSICRSGLIRVGDDVYVVE